MTTESPEATRPTPPEQWAGPSRRRPEEIIARVAEVERADWMGTQRSDLISQLPFEHAKPFLVETATPDDWPPADPDLWARAEEYLDFAAEKIENERGLSAIRSVDHYLAWAFLLDPTGEGLAAVEAAPYEPYGEPQVAAFAKHFGMRWPRSI